MSPINILTLLFSFGDPLMPTEEKIEVVAGRRYLGMFEAMMRLRTPPTRRQIKKHRKWLKVLAKRARDATAEAKMESHTIFRKRKQPRASDLCEEVVKRSRDHAEKLRDFHQLAKEGCKKRTAERETKVLLQCSLVQASDRARRG